MSFGDLYLIAERIFDARDPALNGNCVNAARVTVMWSAAVLGPAITGRYSRRDGGVRGVEARRVKEIGDPLCEAFHELLCITQ